MTLRLQTAHDSLFPVARQDSFEKARLAAGPTILIVDDDAGLCEFLSALLGTDFLVCVAATGGECLRLARAISFGLAIIEFKLSDTSGLELLRALRRESAETKLILMGGVPTTTATVQAMRAGAFHVLEKPIDVGELTTVVRDALVTKTGRRASVGVAATRALATPGSAAERWVRHVIQGCESEDDLRTIERWAHAAAVSYSTLREVCRLVGVRPHAARDFVRVLRILIQSDSFRRDSFSTRFDIGDRRTLRTLLNKAGLANMADTTSARSMEVFLDRQTFVPRSGETYRLLRAVLETASGTRLRQRFASQRS